MSTSEQLQAIIENLVDVQVDAEKIDAGAYGSKSACKRVRGAAQQAKKDLQDLRIAVLAVQKA